VKKQEREFWIAIAALAISVAAALFSAMQWFEARQIRIDDEKHFDIARQDAEKIANAQGAEVQRSAASAERSAKSSERSTDIAGESLRLNRDIFQISERAFVHPKSMSFVVEANKPAKVTVEVQNAGRTTAKGTVIFVNILLRNATLPENPEDQTPSSTLVTPVDLVAGDIRTSTVATSRSLSEGEVNGIKAGTLYLYSYGHIDYRDIFAHPRKSTFCAQYNKDEPDRSHSCPFQNTVE